MDVKDFGVKVTLLCFISILSHHSVKGYASSLKCCFEILGNLSISFHLNEPPGDFCTPTWSEMEYVVVDEHGNVDEKKVVYLEPQKLILKQNTDGKVKEVKYRKDCQLHAYTASCHDPCNALVQVNTTDLSPVTQAPDDHTIHITIGVIVIIVILIILIVILCVICLRRKCQSLNVSFRCIWKAVPKNESPTLISSDVP